MKPQLANLESAPSFAWPAPEGTTQISVFGNSMLPLYRHGDVLIVSDRAPMRVGDRIVIRTAADSTIGGVLVHMDRNAVVIAGQRLGKHDTVVNTNDIAFMGRVIWASQ